jgi:alkylation response protein AidB-like acyl-CoA dehydrogenase
MEFNREPAHAAFRESIRPIIRECMSQIDSSLCRPRGSSHSEFEPERMRVWTKLLHARGLSVPRWPVEWGGKEWSPTIAAIFEDELCNAGAPLTDPIGIGFVGPVIYTFGNEHQKATHLPGISEGTQLWCQGFSEAHAGSDVMSIRTMAMRRTGEFVVTGRKQWISNAHNADFMVTLVRVQSPGNRRQLGLSFLVIDMRAPGVRVTPVVSLDGRHWINEITLENVIVPEESLIGEPGQGWVYARFLLNKERTVVAGLSVIRRMLGTLCELIDSKRHAGSRPSSLASSEQSLCEFYIELRALAFLELRIMSAHEDSARGDLSPILKLRASVLRQKISEALLDGLGEICLKSSPLPAAMETCGVEDGDLRAVVANYLFQRSATIAGGTSEIQRNIISGIHMDN